MGEILSNGTKSNNQSINHHRPASLIILVGRGLRYFTGRKLWLHFLFGLLWRGLIICPLSVCAKIKNVRANICNVCSLCPIFRSFTEFLWSSLDYAESKGLFFVCFKLFFGEFFLLISDVNIITIGLSRPGIEPRSLPYKANALPTEPQRWSPNTCTYSFWNLYNSKQNHRNQWALGFVEKCHRHQLQSSGNGMASW